MRLGRWLRCGGSCPAADVAELAAGFGELRPFRGLDRATAAGGGVAGGKFREPLVEVHQRLLPTLEPVNDPPEAATELLLRSSPRG